jgi:hypothetical protein
MVAENKLSIFLNKFRSHEDMSSEGTKRIEEITRNYVRTSEKQIIIQPQIALRKIKIEMIDIQVIYHFFEKELQNYVNKLDDLRLGQAVINSHKIEELEGIRNTLAEFLNCIAESLAYMLRLLLEHFTINEIRKEFIDQFIKYLGPFDWLGKRVIRISQDTYSQNNNKPDLIDKELITKVKKHLLEGQTKKGLDMLIAKIPDNDLLDRYKIEYSNVNKNFDLGLLTEESYRAKINAINYRILSFLK